MISSKYLAAALLSATACFADTAIVTFTNLPYTTGENVATGWSIATVNLGSANVTNQLLMCSDYLDKTTMPSDPLTFDYSILGADISGNTVSTALLYGGQANATREYEEAAYLTYEYWLAQPVAPVNPTTTQNQTATDYNFAVWNIFDSAAPVDTTQQNLQTAALNYITNGANATFLMNTVYMHTALFTPSASLNSANNQEFEQFLGTPEPGAGWLAIAGIAALVAARRRK